MVGCFLLSAEEPSWQQWVVTQQWRSGTLLRLSASTPSPTTHRLSGAAAGTHVATSWQPAPWTTPARSGTSTGETPYSVARNPIQDISFLKATCVIQKKAVCTPSEPDSQFKPEWCSVGSVFSFSSAVYGAAKHCVAMQSLSTVWSSCRSRTHSSHLLLTRRFHCGMLGRSVLFVFTADIVHWEH